MTKRYGPGYKEDFQLTQDKSENAKQFDNIPSGYTGTFVYDLTLWFFSRDKYKYDISRLAALNDVDIIVVEHRGLFRSKLFFKLVGEKKELLKVMDGIVDIHSGKTSSHE